MAYRFVPFLMTLKHFTPCLKVIRLLQQWRRASAVKEPGHFEVKKILKPGQVTQSPGRRKGLA